MDEAAEDSTVEHLKEVRVSLPARLYAWLVSITVGRDETRVPQTLVRLLMAKFEQTSPSNGAGNHDSATENAQDDTVYGLLKQTQWKHETTDWEARRKRMIRESRDERTPGTSR